MDESLKISLMELVMGWREPTSGKERHFLKVIKNEARACTPEEKEWFEWYQRTHSSGRKKVHAVAKTSKITKPIIISAPSQSHKKKMPSRVRKILDQNNKWHIQDSDALHPKRRVSGSYGSGKKSR